MSSQREEPAAAEKNPRGRPRKYSDETLVTAALRVMEREGYAALTIRSLAAELGTSHTTLYNYIDSIEEIEAKAVHKLTDELPSPRSTSAPELRAELKGYMLAGRKLLLQHPGVMLSTPGSASAQRFQEIADRWYLALLTYAPDMKTVQLAMGALLATVLMTAEVERRTGADFTKKNRKRTAKPADDSLDHYSFEQYLDAMIDFVFPGLSSSSQKPASKSRGGKRNEK